MRRMILLLAALAAACSSAQSKSDVVVSETLEDQIAMDQTPTDGPPPCVAQRTTGQPCSQDCECLAGACLLNEWAPFRFCSRDCSTLKPGEYCPPDPGLSASTSVCIQLKSEFNPEPQRFCAPLCVDGPMACKATANPWESCETPSYKKVPLLDTSDEVCMAASAHGHAPIDPDTCAGWDALYSAWPVVEETCSIYCQFLDECRLIPSDAVPACCHYACARYLAPEAAPVPANLDTLQCLNQTWSSYQKTGLACTKPKATCGEPVMLTP